MIGFLLAGESLDTVYVSGDNASLDVVRDIARRVGPVEVAVLFAGAVQIPKRFDSAYLTLSADHAVEAAIILQARAAIPLHFEGWTHFGQGAIELRAAFHGNGVPHLLRLPARGATVDLTPNRQQGPTALRELSPCATEPSRRISKRGAPARACCSCSWEDLVVAAPHLLRFGQL